MNQLQIFKNTEFGEIRTTQINGEPWFVAADVCKALDIARTSDAVSRLDEDEKGTVSTDTLGGKQNLLAINESGLYSLVLGSRKPEARQFKRWITHDVIPTIRKTGGYVADENTFLNTYLPYADEQTRELFGATLKTIRSLNSKIESDKPKVLFADAVSASHTSILVGDLAKILKQNGIETGQKRLFEWLRENDYLMKKGTSYNMPTQRAMEKGLFEVKETTINNPDGSIRVTRTTKVTGAGQCFFVNRLLAR